MTRRHIISGGHIATVDTVGTEHPVGHLVIDERRIVAVGAGPAPAWAFAGLGPGGIEPAEPVIVNEVAAGGCLVTPGLINTHHHLYQWLTRGIAQQSILFDWLVALYPTWSRIDADVVGDGAAAALAVLARSGCTTVSDHHYIYPQGGGDIAGSLVHAASRIGVRYDLARGSMDLGASDGGLPPDFAVESTTGAIDATALAVARFHDPSPEAMVRVAVAPCSPFSVTTELMREGAVLARELGVRLHTHGSETVEESAFCLERFGLEPTDYFESLGWLGSDVWMAHCVHLSDSDVARYAATGTGVAHCPSSNARLAAGTSPVPALLRAGAPVGLGVDGAASNESGQLGTELRNAVLMARLRWGVDSLTARDALRMATIGGARVLGRDAELGSLEVGKLADVAVWRIDGPEHAGIHDPVAALGLGGMPPVERLFVGGDEIVRQGSLVREDERLLADASARASRALLARV